MKTLTNLGKYNIPSYFWIAPRGKEPSMAGGLHEVCIIHRLKENLVFFMLKIN
jgi:hypothetical protein